MEQVRADIEGYYDEKKLHEYQTLEYGTIYNNTISNILEHTFGGRPKHRTFGNTFIFDLEELTRVGRAYNLKTDIQTKIIDIEQSNITKDEGMKAPSPLGKPPLPEKEENQAQNQDKIGRVPSIEPSEPSEPSNINQEESSSSYYYQCYHCDSYQTNDKADFEQHNVLKHPGKGAYPNKAEIEKRGLKPQDKPWEV